MCLRFLIIARMLSATIPTVAFLASAPLMAAEWTSPHPLAQEEKAAVSLLPFPSHVEWKEGTLQMDSSTAWNAVLTVNGKTTEGKAADILPGDIRPVFQQLTQRNGSSKPLTRTLSVTLDKADAERLGREGYELDVTQNGISVKAATDAGAFYAMQTLRQLAAHPGGIPCCHIVDKPAYAIRGFLYDAGRNYRTIDDLKNHLDQMAKVKLNTFNWHLTDYPAWRIECKKYPILNDPSKRTKDRDVDKTYSYDEIRELFRYARERHIQIIPEIDMPGHSDYFTRCFGFKMASDKGQDILEELLEEFCREIPADISPWLHIGADEIHIPNAVQFAKRMSDKVKSLGRKPIQWGGKNDLPVPEGVVAQVWGDQEPQKAFDPAQQPGAFFDSTMGYLNSADPASLVRRNFFRQYCGVPTSNDKALGTFLCLWPDVRVSDKSKINLQNGVYPVMYSYAERAWKGSQRDASHYTGYLPKQGTEPRKAFELFEKRLEDIQRAESADKALPFPYWRDSFMRWTVVGPAPKADAENVRNAILNGDLNKLNIAQRQEDGGNLYFRTRAMVEGIFRAKGPGVTAWATTTLHSDADRTMYAYVGFDAPGRATRLCSGMPKAGEWSQCGTRIWLNGKELKNPVTFKLAGQHRYEQHTWFKPANEIPFDNEEFWWARDPVPFQLKKGENTLVIEQPYTGKFQSWGISFIPVRRADKSDHAGTIEWVPDRSVMPEKP